MSHSLLIVDDNDDISFLLQLVLESEGYQVVKAYDGKTTLSIIEQLHPRMLLLDIMMPGINGMEIARKIREKFQPEEMPILLVSADHNITPMEVKQSGANAIVYKPFDLDELLSNVEMLLTYSHSKAA